MSRKGPFDIEGFQELIDRICNGHIGTMLLSAEEANELYDKRIKQFGLFLVDQPPDIMIDFQCALDLLKDAHSQNENTLSLYDDYAKQYNETTETELLLMACRKLNDADVAAGNSLQRIEERKQLLNFLLGYDIKSKEDISISEAIEIYYKDNSAGIFAAKMDMVLLIELKESIKIAIDLRQSANLMVLFSRGIFYRAIVEGQGSLLARLAKQEALVGHLKNAPGEVWSTMLGPLFAPAKILAGLIYAGLDTEGNLDEFVDNHANDYVTLKSFIETYNTGVASWMSWHLSLNENLDEANELVLRSLSTESSQG